MKGGGDEAEGRGRKEHKPDKRGLGKSGEDLIVVTADVFHLEISPLNKDAYWNM